MQLRATNRLHVSAREQAINVINEVAASTVNFFRLFPPTDVDGVCNNDDLQAVSSGWLVTGRDDAIDPAAAECNCCCCHCGHSNRR